MPRPRRSSYILELAGAALVGTLVFFLLFGYRIVNPTFVDWLMQGDLATHTLGWWFFRNDTWQFPLGAIQNFPYPLGTNILQSDSIPIVAIVCKIISHWLPTPFQYFGLWQLINFQLFSLFAYYLVSQFTEDRILRFTATIFFAFLPVLPFRFGHPSLCVHWVLLAYLIWAIQLSQNYRFGRPLKLRWIQMGLIPLLLVGVHPYMVFATMVLTTSLYLGAFLAHRTQIQFRWFLVRYLPTVLVVILAAALFGYFGVSEPRATMLGFSTDLLAPIHSFGVSSILPRLRVEGGIHEGFAYLGLGGIFLAGYALYLRKKNRGLVSSTLKPNFALLFMWGFIALAIFSYSPHIRFGGNIILKLDLLYFPLEPLFAIFRSMGRFIWPGYYLLVLILVVIVIRTTSPKRAFLILILAIALQWADMGRWYLHGAKPAPTNKWDKLIDPFWKTAGKQARTLYLIPPYIPTEFFNDVTLGQFTYDDYVTFGAYTALSQLNYNSALVARAPSNLVATYSSQFINNSIEGNWDPEGLYVLHPVYFKKYGFPAHAACKYIDGYHVCFKRNSKTEDESKE